ncbi:amidohydrolase family protein [Sinorhizobium medicae]|nr:amidohydrolase family protein [Sinorhizobium medicae]MDX0575242.1 amidohydrolase family protein [Sinorhizobium medicae]MDX0778818.1 amidohydrolase family protein [Sinorhizobium medicae]
MIFQGATDAHVHLWDPARNDDILVLKHQPELVETARRDRLAAHLRQIEAKGAIVVQSAPTKAHSDWLRSEAGNIDGVIGIVGWLDIFAADCRVEMEDLISDPLVCGIRIMLNRMASPETLINPASLTRIGELADSGLAIECLTPPEHLDVVARLATEVERARIVVDHCGLPPVSNGFAEWKVDIASLAGLPNVTTKFSGLTEPFGPDVRLADIAERADWILGLFGPARLMAASNFPVCELGGGVARWSELLEEILSTAGLSPEEYQAIRCGSASRVYTRGR